MSDKDRYSISRAIGDMIRGGVPTGRLEADFHFDALRTSEKSGLSRMLGWPGKGFIAPLRGLSPINRQLSIAESGWTGLRLVEELGVLAWSS